MVPVPSQQVIKAAPIVEEVRLRVDNAGVAVASMVTELVGPATVAEVTFGGALALGPMRSQSTATVHPAALLQTYSAPPVV